MGIAVSWLWVTITTLLFGVALIGMWLRRRIPPGSNAEKSLAAIPPAADIISRMTTVILGLVTAFASNSYLQSRGAMMDAAVDIITIDRLLVRYGDEAESLRPSLKSSCESLIQRLERGVWEQPGDGARLTAGERFTDALHALIPRDARQEDLKRRALDLAEPLLEARWSLRATDTMGMPPLLLAFLTAWYCVVFLGQGVSATRSVPALVALFVAAAVIGSAIYLSMEMLRPLRGNLSMGAAPLRDAVSRLASCRPAATVNAGYPTPFGPARVLDDCHGFCRDPVRRHVWSDPGRLTCAARAPGALHRRIDQSQRQGRHRPDVAADGCPPGLGDGFRKE